ncbi:TRAP transporter, DctM subunit [Cohaesibacter marisflavi]|uniref:TRAP transporter large permease protein n=1 Tax=Cohaesibacter marisflavi TaxID=655353 RepID=A0A1I4ZBN4_9HYPH|nr:TRAP transporter large permease [Cohaesibacter marisflavi]SFN47433.1 TRAP transporter, DctM subunit [Cohaesibacter marisflavi]
MTFAFSLMLVVFGLLAILGVPLSFTTGIASLVYFMVSEQSMRTVIHQFFTSIDSFVLLAVPLFVMAGHVMSACRITDNIVSLANLLVGRMRGGLAQVNVVASMLFGGCSGSALADVAGLGSVLIPAMKKNGYSEGFSAAVTVASSVQGPIIPPSIPMVIFASVAQVSTGALLVGGALPGVLLGLAQMLVVWLIASRRGYRSSHGKYMLEEVIKICKSSIPALLMPVILMGGILSGIFTPTEAASVAVGYALLLGFFLYRNVGPKELLVIGAKVARDSAAIFFLIGTAGIFGWILAVAHLPQIAADWIRMNAVDPLMVLLVINVFLLMWGMFMDAAPAILILGPILTPIATAVGINPIHFGVIMVFNLMIGLMTPPYGLCLFAGAAITSNETRIGAISREILPFLFISIGVLALISLFPDLVLYLPRLAGLM